jgi:hypothetical protein
MRRWLWPAGLYAALAVAFALPLVRAIGSAFPHDAGDPVLNAWILWWSTRHVPLTGAWWSAPMFYPMASAMALSEVLVGLLPISAPVQWLSGNPVAAYNAAFLLSFPLCGLAAYALAFEVTRRQGPSLAAGVAFAFAPYRMGQLAHLQMLSYYWAPVALLGLHRFVRTRRHRWLIVFGGAWLMQSLCNGYAMFHLSILVALWIVWFARSRRDVVPIAAAWACAALPLVPMLLTYQRVHRALHLVRDINEVKRFSADLAGFLSAPPELTVWGHQLLSAGNETAVFPGITIVVVAIAGAAYAFRRRRPGRWRWTAVSGPAAAVCAVASAVALSALVVGPWSIPHVLSVTVFYKPFTIASIAAVVLLACTPAIRSAWQRRSVTVFYVMAAVAMYVLALGPSPTFLGAPVLYEPPYAWLMRLPGFDVLRVPARFAMLGVLCQGVFAAVVLAQWTRAASRRAGAVVALACAGFLVDGWAMLPVAPAPARVPAWSGVSAVLELPIGSPAVDFGAIYRSMFHGRPIVNGYSGYAPPHYVPLVHALRDGHDEVLDELAAYGSIGVAISDSEREEPRASSVVQALGGRLRRIDVWPGWTTLIAPEHPRTLLASGPAISVAHVDGNRHPEDTGRMLDGDVRTAWGSGAGQDGGEQLVIDLGTEQRVGGLVFRMGAYAFGFPRTLVVESSRDGAAWSHAWEGSTAVATVRAALADPGDVPLTIELRDATARWLRIRQTGREADIPWWIAELGVFAPQR